MSATHGHFSAGALAHGHDEAACILRGCALARPRLVMTEWEIVAGIFAEGTLARGPMSGGWLDFGQDLEKVLTVWFADEGLVRRFCDERQDRFESQVKGLWQRGLVTRHAVEPWIGLRINQSVPHPQSLSPREREVAGDRNVLESSEVRAAAAAANGPAVREGVEPSADARSVDGSAAAAATQGHYAGALLDRPVGDRGGGGGEGAAVAANGSTLRSDVTFNRSDVSTIKRSDRSSYVPSLAAAAAADVCREAVRLFVGDADFARYWARHSADYVFEEDRAALIRAYNYLVAGVRSGEVKVRTNNGRTLFAQFRFEREFLNRTLACRPLPAAAKEGE